MFEVISGRTLGGTPGRIFGWNLEGTSGGFDELLYEKMPVGTLIRSYEQIKKKEFRN